MLYQLSYGPSSGRAVARLRAPQPVVPWDGERDATPLVWPTSPQTLSVLGSLDLVAISNDGWHRGDDYLTLNVWAPVRPSDTPRPVMVWIHGGAFINGHKDLEAADGASFARSGAVTVSINYRLGVEGFLPIDGAPTNLGLRDMISALQWVQRNIGRFGGDPGNVTIFGESAGGMSVACLMVSPLAEGLFSRVIAQSGAGSMVIPVELAKRSVARVAKHLGVSPDVAGFASRPAEDALKAYAKASRPGAVDLRDDTGLNAFYGFLLAGPVYGDDVLPEHPLAALQHGAGKDVDLLIGTTTEEAKIFFSPTPLRLAPKPVARWVLRHVHPDGNRLYDTYARRNPGLSGGMVWCAALTDLAFRWPARQFAEAHQGRSHVYEFDWASPALGGRLGIAHGVDIAFTFDNLAAITGPKRVGGDAPPQEVATHLHELCARFGRDGTLPWPEFDPVERPVYQITARRAVSEPVLPAADFLPALKTYC